MKITAIVLAGGKGTRIAKLFPYIPKPMIPVAGQPFLFWLLRWLISEGVSDIVFSVGHMASQIEKWVAEQTTARPDLKLRSVVETEALGTGGAVRHCLEGSAPWVMVLNGDSLQKVDLSQLGERIEREQLDGIIVAASQDDTSRYGALDIDENWTLRGFHEKRPGQGLINAGIYLFRRSALLNIPKSRPSSLETDVIPAMLASGAKIGVAVGQGDFLDIGTPESVMLAEDFIRRSFR